MRLGKYLLAGLFIAFLGTGSFTQAEEDPSYLEISAGTWETLRPNRTEPEVDLTYRSNVELWVARPQVGVVAARDGDYYAFGGLASDIALTSHIILTPVLDAGLYGGGGFRLGSHMEFREGGELAYRFQNASRLGVAFYHLSNAGLTSRNPGSESALMSYALPLSDLVP